jgi:hypothetical protein
VLFKIVTCIRKTPDDTYTGKPYNFLEVGAVMTTKRGSEMVLFNLDGKSVQPEVGKEYVPEIEFYPNKERKLAFSVRSLRAPTVAKAA